MYIGGFLFLLIYLNEQNVITIIKKLKLETDIHNPLIIKIKDVSS